MEELNEILIVLKNFLKFKNPSKKMNSLLKSNLSQTNQKFKPKKNR